MINYKELITEENLKMFNIHDDLKDKSVEELKEICDEQRLPFSVGIINITGGLNVGGIIRSASLFGARRVVIFGRKVFDKRSTVGAHNYIKIKHYKELSSLKINQVMAEHDMTPVFIEQGGTPLPEYQWAESKLWRHPCLIFGNENSGIPDYLLEEMKSFDRISIPQRGVLRSFNVASTASIVMYDLSMKMGWV
jgi:tRNA G18 (ribose-2'-O)-methylase SpoU